MESRPFPGLDQAVVAFNSGDLPCLIQFFSENLTLNKYPSFQLARGRMEAHKRVDVWLQQYPATQIYIINQMWMDANVIVQVRISRHPGYPPFDMVLMIDTLGDQIVKIDLLIIK